MKSKLLFLLAACAASTSFGALSELNVPESTIESPDGSFFGRNFKIAPGFKLELLYVAPTREGKWVAVGWDNKGRLLVPSYNSDVLTRLTIPKVGSNDPVKSELITGTPVGAAEGVLYAFNSLYINANRSQTLRSGIYRLTDTNGDDMPDRTSVINNVRASGDHGTHTLQLSPDKRIYNIQGNATRMTEHNRSRVPEIWGEDNLVMRMDLSPPGFHRAPDGHMFSFNEDGTDKELYAMGMRNPVSFAFNKDGEVFVYDADEEPNMGYTVAYRPTSILHVISGNDAGWRSGSKVHPDYYFDYFGSIAEVGSGSPVGSAFGTGTKFPARYQDAFYAGDWSFGNLWAVMLTPDGSSYKASVEPFMSGKPFAVSGIIPNPADGSLLVATTGTELYRITYVGNESTDPTLPDTRFAALRDLRHSLEKFHGKKDAAAVIAAWPYLGDPDRAIRFAARTAIEWQDVGQWSGRALAETDPRKSIAAIVALARVSSNDVYHTPPDAPNTDDKALEDRMLASLDRIDWNSLSFQDKLDLTRAYQLVMIRLGMPNPDSVKRLIARFDPRVPANQMELNREITQILIYLKAPSAAAKALALLKGAPVEPYFGIKEWPNPQMRQRQDRGDDSGPNLGVSQASLMKQDNELYYAQLLRTLTDGWTPELRKEYMEYFVTAPKDYIGSMNGLAIIRTDAIAQIPADEKPALQSIIDTPMPTGRGRPGRAAAAAGAAPGAAAAPVAPGAAGGVAAAGGAGGFGGGGGRGGGGAGTPGLITPANLFIPIGRNQAFSDPEMTGVTRFDESFGKETADQTAAANALALAAWSYPSNPAQIQARAKALADADLALATARANGFSALKTQLKISDDRIPAFVQAITTRGGGRGGGGAAGAAPAGAGAGAAAGPAAPGAAPTTLPAGRGN